MAVRPKEPQQGNTTALAAVLLVATCVTAPAFATSDRDLNCDDDQVATLEVSQYELSATPVNTTDELLENHLLKPRVDATLREVFADGDDTSEADEVVEDEVEATEPEPAIRSVSDGEMTPLSRRMYRRDI